VTGRAPSHRGSATTAWLCLALAALATTVSSSAAASSALEGRWKTKPATLQELRAAGVPAPTARIIASRAPRVPALDFHAGSFKGIDLETGRVLSTGSYRVEGSLVHLVFTRGFAVRLGQSYQLRWSIYRDRLTLSNVPGRPPLQALTVKPWTRVR
jgi:hypothetical protein